MKRIQISTDRILLILIIVLLWCNTLIKACESDLHNHPEPTLVSVKSLVQATTKNASSIDRYKI